MPEPRVLLPGIALGESPRWHDGRLWFCDWGAKEIIAVDETGRGEVVVPDCPGAALLHRLAAGWPLAHGRRA